MDLFKLLGLKKKGLSILIEFAKQFGRDGLTKQFEIIFRRTSPKGRAELAKDLKSIGTYLELGEFSSAATTATDVIFEDIKV